MDAVKKAICISLTRKPPCTLPASAEMHHFDYRDERLHAEDVALTEIAERYGTPCYVYSRATIEDNWRGLDAAFGSQPHLVCYAVKLTRISRFESVGENGFWIRHRFQPVNSSELLRLAGIRLKPFSRGSARALKRCAEVGSRYSVLQR